MSSVIATAETHRKGALKPFQEEDFTNIRRLLLKVGKPHWSERPRTYLVLRLIGEVQAMAGFVFEGLKDIHFPYTEEHLPSVLSSRNSRYEFRAKQTLVLSSKGTDIVEGGPHRNLGRFNVGLC